jgi:glyoxylase-like metal-dependent hydrolase (beta-lactamase superfamily II)
MFAAILLLSGSAVAADPGPFVLDFEEIAPGVWTGIRADSPRYPVMGNTTFVISSVGVVVFDGGGMPAMADLVIEKIRSLTDKPVTHVVISHWHGDHFFGAFRFAEEFPGVEIIAHRFTRDIINSSRINYIDRQIDYLDRNRENFKNIVATGLDDEGTEYNATDRHIYERMLDDYDVIIPEFSRARVIPPNIVFTDDYLIDSGERLIELLFLGHANTAGDIVLWLPQDRIVATGDIVVLPSPYAFNAPTKRWADTLRNVKALDFEILVPGHGPAQRDTAYVDLLIETVEAIAKQRDRLVKKRKPVEEIEAELDFSAFEKRFTGGDEYVRTHYEQWFVEPFRAAVMKELTGEPMVEIPPGESAPFDDPRWQIDAAEYEVAEYLGQTALRIKGGAALLPLTDIRNGLVEFDIAITPERGFAGLMFRWQDAANYENFYLRPHQSGNPDANQYQPVINGAAAWQLYYGEGYAAPVEYRYDEWMHVRVIYAESQAEVYIDSDTPVLRITDLRRADRDGAIGVSAADFSAVHFANFKYTALSNAYTFAPAAKQEFAAGTIKSWIVSDPFDERLLAGEVRLGREHTAGRRWTPLAAEATGIANLANVAAGTATNNTVFARYVINAARPQTRRLTFGYSDRARVYLNGTLLYKGDNGYLTRDYRYLGTIGLFDSIALPLKGGDNELWIAISEDSGGWGIMGRISDYESAH